MDTRLRYGQLWHNRRPRSMVSDSRPNPAHVDTDASEDQDNGVYAAREEVSLVENGPRKSSDPDTVRTVVISVRAHGASLCPRASRGQDELIF